MPPGTVSAWTRSSSPSSRSAPLLHVAWNVRLKTAGDPLRAATVGMLAASFGIVPAGILVWWLRGGGRPRRSRASRSASCRASSRPATSSCCRPPTGGATCRSSTRSPAARRRSWPWRSGSACWASGSGSPGSFGVVAAAARVPAAPAAVAGPARPPGRRPGDHVRRRDRGDDRRPTAPSTGSGRGIIDRSRTPRSCG